MIERFHYLTQDLEGVSHSELSFRACERGVRWVQFRSKGLKGGALFEEALAVKKVTDCFSAVLIVNDHVELAAEIDAAGVHLGQNDMDITQARTVLGGDKIIGGTANTEHEVKKLIAAGVSYLGVGPYRFTRTKEKLSPLLGIAGFRTLLKAVNAQVPLIAIGGIEPADVPALLSIGMYGVAASSAAHVLNSKSALKDFLRTTSQEEGNVAHS
jgi:thiamine-phosphate pyrophosphorylase